MLIFFLYYFSILVVVHLRLHLSLFGVDSSERLLLRRAQQVVPKHPMFVVGSCVDSEGISCCLAEIVCRSRSSIGTVCEIVCQNNVWIARGINFGGVDCFRNSSRVSRGGKDPIII